MSRMLKKISNSSIMASNQQINKKSVMIYAMTQKHTKGKNITSQ